MATLNIRLEDEIKDQLKFLAKKTDRSKAYHVRQAIKGYLADLEDSIVALESEQEEGEDLTHEDMMKLTANDSRLFVANLLNPPEPNAKLKRASRRYQQINQSKR